MNITGAFFIVFWK